MKSKIKIASYKRVHTVYCLGGFAPKENRNP